jgi:hypothetical protein
MDDIQFRAIVEDFIDFVDEKYGRKYAWAAFSLIILIFIAIILGIYKYFF